MRTGSVMVMLALFALCALPSAAQEARMKSPLAAEMSADVARLSEKWVSLFEAMPEDKLDWRPQEGVRSVRELFTHIADANYFFLTFAGFEMPKGPEMPKERSARENRLTTKADIARNLKASFENAHEKIGMISDETMGSMVSMFGNETTSRSAMLINVGHMHEHLGQAIAYARVNGVTPPWSQEN